MTREDALKQVNEWYIGTITEHAHWKLINEIYDAFEFEMECYKQCEHQLALCETALEEADRQLDNLNINLEAQEIMIADYKKRINELEAPKSCDGCMYYSVDNWNDFVCLHTIPCSRSCDDYYRKRISDD